MMDDSVIRSAAQALQACAAEFDRPVTLYVEGESEARWEKANAGKYAFDDDAPKIDWDLESWKILARAVLEDPAVQKSIVHNALDRCAAGRPRLHLQEFRTGRQGDGNPDRTEDREPEGCAVRR